MHTILHKKPSKYKSTFGTKISICLKKLGVEAVDLNKYLSAYCKRSFCACIPGHAYQVLITCPKAFVQFPAQFMCITMFHFTKTSIITYIVSKTMFVLCLCRISCLHIARIHMWVRLCKHMTQTHGRRIAFM